MLQSDRFQKGFFEILRFGGVGLAATAVHSLAYMVGLKFLMPQSANLLGYTFAAVISYFGHEKFTFSLPSRTRLDVIFNLIKFSLASIIGLLLNSGFIYITLYILKLDPLFAVFFIGGVTPVLTFLLFKFWVFQTPNRL
jgi:putative flippase GtrA